MGGPQQPILCSHTKRSSDSSSPQSPHGAGGVPQQQQLAKISSSSKSGVRSSVGPLDTTTSTNRSSRSNPSGGGGRGDALVEKPEKYLDKMLLREKGAASHHQMKLPLNVESQFVSKTATITSQNNMGTGSSSHRGTNPRVSPKCVDSAEVLLSKSNLDRHNRDLAQSETQQKLKKRSPTNTNFAAAVAVTPKSSKLPPGNTKHRQPPQTRTNTYASDVDYDAGNMSPLYSNWDQQEHLLPLQHYIIEQAKLSKYNKYFAANSADDSVDSDSLHSDSQSEHSFSGHEPDNEDSDHSEGRGDYLTYQQHYMGGDEVVAGDADRQNYYNVFDKNNGRGEDL